MGYAAHTLGQPRERRSTDLRLIQGGLAVARAVESAPSPVRRDIVFLGSLMVLLQLLDGVFTGIGIWHFGTGMEGNYLLRSLMELVGFLPALILVKGASIALTGVLCVQASKLSWVRSAFIGVIGIYLFAAILPWTYILCREFLV